MTMNRRTALGLAATAGGASALTACAGGDGEDTGDDDAGAGGSGDRVPTADVPEGGGTIRDSVVVTQPTAGEFKAFDASCPHQGCAVEEVTAEAIVCPCHGSEFDPATGDVTKGPATEGLSAMTATVEGDEIVIS